ncbi:MAG TPA: PQQ-dependent dehydrogenase, methanol/ethanol family [Vicinamibacterales bacterium]
MKISGRFGIGVVLGVAAGAAVLLGQANQSDTVRNPLAADPSAVPAGRQLYDQTCQACHGPAGQGDRGPALDRPTLPHGDNDGDLFHTIRAGLPGTQMPPFARLTDNQVWQLVTYIRSIQGRTPANSAAAATTVAGDPAAGEALFFGAAGCAACHEVNGRGGITGPDLSNAGREMPAALRQKIVDPNRPAPPVGGGRGAPPPVTIVVKTRDGREIRGVRRNEDTFSLQMVDAAGRLHLLDKAALASQSIEARSLMPSDYATRLSASDLQNLIAFLARQRGRDLAKTSAQPLGDAVPFDRLKNAKAEPHNWLMYWGDYQGTHFSPLDQVTPANVKTLRAAWAAPIPGTITLETAPVVVDGLMYVTSGGDPLTVLALDARTGRQVWRYARPQQVKNPYEINPYNRGVAVLGNRVYVGTLDAALVSLDARTGLPMWEAQIADTMEGHSITSPPLAVKDKVIVGVTGGEFATRGFIQAFDAASGKPLWRFYTVPGPGEFGHETWKGESWRTGGSPAWLTGTYDPELNTVFWPVGNPAPEFDRSARGELDNLFSNSVVALDPDTGRRKWHYQFTPNDGHDWDAVEDLMLVDRVWHGTRRKLLLHANRNAHFYVLDRTDGRFLAATPFVYQNWNTGFDEKGRPIAAPGSNSSEAGSFLVYPTLGGGTNFQAPSYSPRTGWFYLEYSESGQQYVSAPQQIERGRQYLGRGAASGPPPGRRGNEPAPSAGIKALDPETGKTMWDFKIFQGSVTNGLLATGGNVVFASTRDGNLVALDAKSGAHLWHIQTGSVNAASPMSYSVNGRQYIALAAGTTIYAFALPE